VLRLVLSGQLVSLEVLRRGIGLRRQYEEEEKENGMHDTSSRHSDGGKGRPGEERREQEEGRQGRREREEEKRGK